MHFLKVDISQHLFAGFFTDSFTLAFLEPNCIQSYIFNLVTIFYSSLPMILLDFLLLEVYHYRYVTKVTEKS